MDVLIRATELVMGKHGFHGTTTNRIADAAGVSIGTLYHYFPTKEALVEAVVHRMWRSELEILIERRHLMDAMPIEQSIRETVRALVAAMAKQRDLYRSWYEDAPHLGQLAHGLEMSNDAIAMLRDSLAKRRDEIRPRDLEFAADLVVKTALAVVRTGARDYPKQVASGELAEELTQMLSRYLLKRPPE